jgi:hypothetical protein
MYAATIRLVKDENSLDLQRFIHNLNDYDRDYFGTNLPFFLVCMSQRHQIVVVSTARYECNIVVLRRVPSLQAAHLHNLGTTTLRPTCMLVNMSLAIPGVTAGRLVTKPKMVEVRPAIVLGIMIHSLPGYGGDHGQKLAYCA